MITIGSVRVVAGRLHPVLPGLHAMPRILGPMLLFMLAFSGAGSAQTVIPLLNEPQTGQLGVSVKLGTNPNAFTYLLDTGSSGFFTARGTTSAWTGLISGTVSSSTFDISYGNGALAYQGNIANTTVTFTDATGNPLVVPNIRMGVITNQPYSGWSADIDNVVAGVATPIAPESPTSHLFFGTMGAGLFQTAAKNGSLGSVLGQIPLASGLTRGFIIHTGGSASTSPTLTVGLTPTAISLFPILIKMSPATGTATNDNGTTVTLYPEAQATATYAVATETATYTTQANLIVDSGGQGTHFTIGTDVNPPKTVLSSDGTQIAVGASFATQAPGTPPPGSSAAAQSLNWQIKPTGNTLYVDRVGIDSGTSAGSLNSGVGLFYQYDVLFDIDHGIIGFMPNSTTTASANFQGLWWNPNESGWGISFAHQGDIIFATWFTYDAQGSPWWLIAELHKSATGLYSGPISTVTGPPYTALPFAPAPVETNVGTMTAAFTDPSHGTLAYTVNGVSQTKTIVPQVFGVLPTCVWGAQQNLALATNYTDLWWNASESGWGVSFSHQSDTLFATWYTYDAQGKPWWLVAVLNKTASGVYSGPISTVTAPPFDATPWDTAAVVETEVGTAIATFANGNSATFAYTLNGVAASKTITRQVFAPPGTVCTSPGSAEVSYTLKFLNKSYGLYASIAGGTPHEVQLDTGSLGLNVPRSAVGSSAQISTTETCSTTYVSDGTTLTGHKATGTVALLGSTTGGDVNPPPTTVPISFCAIDSPSFNGGMMGVGYGRGMGDPTMNVLLQMAEVQAGTMHPGYVLSTQSSPNLQIGITAVRSANFQTVQLSPSTSGNGDWVAGSLTGCITLPNTPAFTQECGGMLVDTGVPEMILWGPSDKTLGGIVPAGATAAPSGTAVRITTQAGSMLDWSFVLGAGAESPSAVTIKNAGTFSINTGRSLIVDYDYLFDAKAGLVGFQRM